MKSEFPESARLFAEATKVFPGGVNSPVRAFAAVGGHPLFIKKGEGSYIWDEDGHRYIDYVGSFGPAILGHAHPEVVASVTEALARGFSFGAPSRAESTLAALIMDLVPSVSMLRLVSSGTEACMSALRLARGFTGRSKILKFVGCYHGHADMLLVKAGSGVATFGTPASPGITEGNSKDTLTVAFNDLAAVQQVIATHGRDLAAIILEPIVGNAGFIRPAPGFLQGVRELCNESGALLIFDEVMTGFRVARGGAQALYGIKPDLSTFGKIIGGGMPIGAFGGRADVMEKLSPLGSVYQAGTLSGHPVCVAAGIKTLEILKNADYGTLNAKTQRLMKGLKEQAASKDIALDCDSEGGMFGIAFAPHAIKSFVDIQKADHDRFKLFFHRMLRKGIYLAPSGYEAGFVSFAHSDADIEDTIQAAKASF